MKKAADLALGARPFAMEASGIFSRVAEEISMSPYIEGKEKKKKKGKSLVIVITSNKGLCGAYNINVFREVLKQTKGTKTECITIGKKAREFIIRTGHTLVADYSETFKDDPTPAQVKLSQQVFVSSISRENILTSKSSIVSTFLLFLSVL
jgi:F-type H+-transporting ATPase subunit gamma